MCKNLVIIFFLNLVYNGKLYELMHSWKNLGKVWFLRCVNVFGQSQCRFLERKDEEA